jgi:Ras GTPase-activating-like protein IQGAP2/3
MSADSLLNLPRAISCFSPSLPYDEIKVQALTACMELEQKAIVSRLDGFQSILNSIAYDIRTKNRKQIQRSREIQSMSSTLERLQKKKKGLQEQIEMYHAHNAESISKLQGRGSVNLHFLSSLSLTRRRP